MDIITTKNEISDFWKNNLFFYFIIFLLAAGVTFPFYSGNFHVGNDFAFNYARVMSTLSSLKDGQIIARFDPHALNGFGYAWNEFYGPLPTYLISFLKFLVRGWPLAFALFTSSVVFLSGILIYHFTNFILRDFEYPKVYGLLAALIFIFSNSTYINLYYYANPSQPLVILFALLLLFGVTKLFEKRDFTAFAMISFGVAGLPLSHTVTTICLIPFVFLYSILLLIRKHQLRENLKITLIGFGAVIAAIGLSAFFLFPMLENLTSGIYNVSNRDFSHAFGWNNIGYFVGDWNSLFKKEFLYYNFPSLVSVSLVLITFITSLINFKKKQAQYSLIFSFFALTIVAMQVPIFPWRLFSFFALIQGPSRFSTLFGIFSALALSTILPVVLKVVPKKTVLILSVILLSVSSLFLFNEFSERVKKGSGLLFSGAQTALNNSGFRYEDNPDSIAIGEYLPQSIGTHYQSYDKTIQQFYKDQNAYGMRNQAVNYLNQRGGEPKALSPKITLSEFHKKGSHITLKVSTESKAKVELPEIYYKGFKAYIKTSNKKVQLNTELSPNGLLAVEVPGKFSGKIYSYFGMSPATIWGSVVSLLTFVIIAVALIVRIYKKFFSDLKIK